MFFSLQVSVVGRQFTGVDHTRTRFEMFEAGWLNLEGLASGINLDRATTCPRPSARSARPSTQAEVLDGLIEPQTSAARRLGADRRTV